MAWPNPNNARERRAQVHNLIAKWDDSLVGIYEPDQTYEAARIAMQTEAGKISGFAEAIGKRCLILVSSSEIELKPEVLPDGSLRYTFFGYPLPPAEANYYSKMARMYRVNDDHRYVDELFSGRPPAYGFVIDVNPEGEELPPRHGSAVNPLCYEKLVRVD